jgi:hypothetical protein
MDKAYTVLLKITRGKDVSAHAMKEYSGSVRVSPLTNSALDGGQRLASRPSWFKHRRLGKRHYWSGRFGKQNILHLPGFERCSLPTTLLRLQQKGWQILKVWSFKLLDHVAVHAYQHSEEHAIQASQRKRKLRKQVPVKRR